MNKMSLILVMVGCIASNLYADTYNVKVGQSINISLAKAWQNVSETSNPSGCTTVSTTKMYTGNYSWKFTANKPGTSVFTFKRSLPSGSKQINFVVTQ